MSSFRVSTQESCNSAKESTKRILRVGLIVPILLLSQIISRSNASESSTATALAHTDYAAVVDPIKQVIHDELQQGIVAGVSVALVDKQRVVLADGFGLADKERNITTQTIDKGRMLLPGNNIMGLRDYLDLAEYKIGRAFHLEDAQERRD